MERSEYFDLGWEPAITGSLTFPKAVELVNLILKNALPYAQLVECFRRPEYEIVVIEIEPEVPQYPVHDIQPIERVAILFKASDDVHQEFWALRKYFPMVPHTNFIVDGLPRSLCLYQMKYGDLKPSWTAGALLQQLHSWLSKTARGELHEVGQPLEQVFYSPSEQIILPSALFTENENEFSERLVVRATENTLGKIIFIASNAHQVPVGAGGEHLDFFTFVFTMPPQVHGLIRTQPRTLAELHKYLGKCGDDFLSKLRSQILTWHGTDNVPLRGRLLILLRIPMKRVEEGPIEIMEVWAFASESLLSSIGVDLGVWDRIGNALGRLIPPDLTKKGESTLLYPLNPIQALTRERAAAFNGLKADDRNFIAIGVGSLGSQIVNNLVRAGQGNWTVVDEDQFLPHNVARHYLPGLVVGFGKAKALGNLLEGTFEGFTIQAIEADVLRSTPAELQLAYSHASLILDMSASIAVARNLSLSTDSLARRASLFLNPSGTDLVLLAEPQDRNLRLDQVEMEYYRALINQPELERHLLEHGAPIRYSHACRDVSVRLPQDQVALHAAIGSRAVQKLSQGQDKPYIRIWHTSPELTVSLQEISPEPYWESKAGGWCLNIASRVSAGISRQRIGRLPNETGGVLIGAFDTQHRVLYIIDFLPSPPDSVEWPTAYYRGIEGLAEELERIDRVTGKQIGYVGEWHSHPNNTSTKPSGDDRELFAWLQRYRLRDGLPAVIAIAGDDQTATWYVDDLDSGFVHHTAAF